MVAERRNLTRRNFSYYMRVMDETTGELIGHLSDISTTGFKLDCQKPIPANVLFKMRIENTGQVGGKDYVVFTATARWCKQDQYDSSLYNVGFQLINITPSDYDIFVKMFNAYGEARSDQNYTNLWS
ncbi:MAG: hypothetical protein Fur002_18440 [Anaerolineales bacterium]